MAAYVTTQNSGLSVVTSLPTPELYDRHTGVVEGTDWEIEMGSALSRPNRDLFN